MKRKKIGKEKRLAKTIFKIIDENPNDNLTCQKC